MHFTFPAISPFLELVQHAQEIPDKIIVRDHYSNRTATAGQLLQSVAALREQIQSSQQQNGTSNGVNSNAVSTNGTNGVSASQNKFYYLIAAPGLEYLTSMLTIFSLGGVMSAQSIVIKPEDVLRLFRVAKPKALLHASSLAEKVEAVKALCAEQDNGTFSHLPFYSVGLPSLEKSESHTYGTEPASDEIAAQNGTLFFTSGTSGKQKGVLHSYAALLASAKERIQTWKMTKNDVFLNQKPGNWMGGIFGILPSLISGACLETCAGVFEPKWFWQRIKEGGVSVFDVAPTGYDRLAYYFDEHIAVLPADEVEAHIQGMIEVRVAGVSGSLLSPHTQKRWTELRRGKPLLNLYGSTEMTLICSMSWENPDYPDMCSIGPAVPGVEVKLVDGEMRLKAPTLFTKYISDDTTLTEKAFDEDGFFKSGDCATLNGNSYTLHGRANIDGLEIHPLSNSNTFANSYYSIAFLGLHHLHRRGGNGASIATLHCQRCCPAFA
ncbi:hypothetical protein VHEMI07056 [[Torrubiella] hemipterigena]|uniref:AMP-dependent synthetase/ligase domain-containing protein n=1 Tax=[Torrubiella] hemipterigena TaxID=1531966 RepID=A0A0A1TKZ1_9HYPO|nr:hypothetical protein VHEMI07056 [[Torrubiella] hemipterigena]